LHPPRSSQVNVLYARSRPENFDPLNPTANYPLLIDPSYVSEATALLAEVSIWKDAFSITRPLEERNRLDSGNLIMANALEVSLTTNDFPSTVPFSS